jgi:hypothetical protein
MEISVNYLAVLAAAVAAFAVGFIWYTVLFQKPWAKEMGYNMEEMKNDKKAQAAAGKAYGLSILLSLLTCYMMAHVMKMSQLVFSYSPLTSGVTTAVSMWIGFVGPIQALDSLFGRSSWKLWWINSGYQLISLIVMGIVIGLF